MYARPRRNRKYDALRTMVQETQLSVDHLIYPLFVTNNPGEESRIDALPSIYRWGKDVVVKEVERCIALGIRSFVLFPVVPEELKDSRATYSYQNDNFYLEVIATLKREFPQISLMSDVALDPYSTDGHDGVVENGRILNDESLPILADMSVAQAQAGIDIIGPSDMMDGRVGYIREVLDENGYSNTSIMSYCAKYASAFYGPFREALDSAPKSGDKKTYQMNPANKKEALREAFLDIEEGADLLMVKPALSYLDVIQTIDENVTLPVTAYNVSGEYAMLHAAVEKGWLDYEATMTEMLLSIRRAGAKGILTYFAKDFAQFKMV
ncbi:MAG: porphobilinogen synthase [Bacteroidota bacterium]